MEPIAKLTSYINSTIPYAWDDSESWFEFMGKVLAKVNEIIEKTNDYFDVDVKQFVVDTLNEWRTDGTLESLLNIMFEDYEERFNALATITSSQYNVLGDGTDETSKIASMMNALPSSGGKIVFDKSKEIVINGTSVINISNKQNVVIEGLRAKGSSAAVFQIVDGSKNITFRDCVFKDFGQVIYLHTCEEVLVDNCTFDGTGYGVIQLEGHVSNNVKVINCTAKNMKKDFVEANCTNSAKSKNWIISSNHYLGGSGYPVVSIEERFVGITGVENVIITDNIVENVCGDSAIHLEDVGGNITIANNIIDNVVGTSYIWIIHNEKTALITGNTFLRSHEALNIGYVLRNANIYTNLVKFNNNVVRGTNKNLTALMLHSRSNYSVVGNTFENCNIAISLSDSHDILISSNDFTDNNYDIFANGGSSQLKATDIHVIGNKCKGTLQKCVEVRRAPAGTGFSASERWLVQGNIFENDVVGYDTIDFTVIGNVISAGKTLALGGTQHIGSTGYVTSSNRQIGSTELF